MRTRQGWIGADIGARTVKLAQLERRGQRLQIREAIVVPRRRPWEKVEGCPTDDHDSVSELRIARQMAPSLSGSRSAGVVPMAVCEASYADAGVSDRGSRHGSDADRVCDSWTIPASQAHTDTEPSHQTIVFSAPTQWAGRMALDQQRSGLTCEMMDGLPTVLARAASLSPWGGDAEPTAFLDWGYGTAVLCVVCHGRPVYIRSLARAGLKNVIAALRTALSIDHEDAEQLLQRVGVSNSTTERGGQLSAVLQDAIEEPLHQLVFEIRRTLDYLKMRRSQWTPNRLCLLGGGATVKNIASCLQQRLGVTVDLWRLAGDPREASPQTSRFAPVLWAVPAALSALAWRGRSSPC